MTECSAWPPAACKIAKRAHRKSRRACGQAEHSVIAVEAALALNRVVQIEMELRHHEAWLRLAMREAPRLRVLNVMPADGQHPVQGAPAGETVQ